MASIPEIRLLTLCCAGHDAPAGSLIGNLPAPDWTLLLRSAAWHGMMPQLASRLLPSMGSAALRADVPEFVLETLRTYQEHRLFRSITQIAALLELHREFLRAGIRVIPWKGPSVGALLYGSATLRESVDLDFLLREEDIPQVLEITRRLGYQLLQSSGSESKDVYLLAGQGELGFGRVRDQIALEFHLHVLTSRFTRWQSVPMEIGRASTMCTIAGTDVLLQNPEDLLVSLCAHATKHYWDRLKWSCDIAKFLDLYADKVDWATLLAGLRQERKHSVVLLGLALAADLFDRPLPPAAQKALHRDQALSLLVRDVVAHTMSGAMGEIDPRHKKKMTALLCPRLRDRIVYTLQPFVELNYEDLHIPVHRRTFFFLNYIFRVFRLLKKYGPHSLASKTAVSVRSVR